MRNETLHRPCVQVLVSRIVSSVKCSFNYPCIYPIVKRSNHPKLTRYHNLSLSCLDMLDLSLPVLHPLIIPSSFDISTGIGKAKLQNVLVF